MKSFLYLLLLCLLVNNSCSSKPQRTTFPNGLIIEDVKVGQGEPAHNGNTVTVHYTGWLDVDEKKGMKFDSSKDRNDPFSFPLGAGMVIRGWEEGLQGMKVGGKRTLKIPPDLGYGPHGAGSIIPPNAKLIFDVELLKIK